MLTQLPTLYSNHQAMVNWHTIFNHYFPRSNQPNSVIRFSYCICPGCLKVWKLPNSNMILPNRYCCQRNSISWQIGIVLGAIDPEVERMMQEVLKGLFDYQQIYRL